MFRLRIKPELKRELENAIKEGKAASMSELVREALAEFLKKGIAHE